jgi:predicted acetyltransferase
VVVDPAPVRELPRERALPLVRDIYDRVWHTRAGYLDRTDATWEYYLFDGPGRRDGQTGYRFVVHPQAYAVYRTKLEWQDRGPHSTVLVHTLTAETPAAYAAILRYLLDIDLIGEVVLRLGTDEPLVHMLADPRAAVRTLFDALWVRLVDVTGR